MQGPFMHFSGPLSPTPSAGEIPPPPSSDIEEMLPVGFSELDAIAASPVLDVELLPPPPTDSDSRPSSPTSSYLLPLDGPACSTTDTSTLPETTDQRHDLTAFDVERGFWRVHHGARELLRYATIYQGHRDSMHSHPGDGKRKSIKPLIPKQIDLESMTQLSWGVTRAVADITAYDRRMHMLSSGRQSRFASPRPDTGSILGSHYDPQIRVSKRKKNHRHASSRGLYHAPTDTTDTPLQYNVCKACGTLHSPQWRYGPEGVLNLCNVCGLLHAKKTQRKKMEAEREQQSNTGAGF